MLKGRKLTRENPSWQASENAPTLVVWKHWQKEKILLNGTAFPHMISGWKKCICITSFTFETTALPLLWQNCIEILEENSTEPFVCRENKFE